MIPSIKRGCGLGAGLPEGAPPDVALAEVLVTCCLFYEQLYLPIHVQRPLVGKVVAWTTGEEIVCSEVC